MGLKTRLMMLKVYWGRAVSYLSLINSGMILFLFLVSLKERGYINADLDKYFFPIIILGIFGLIFIGFIEIKLFKSYQEEFRIAFSLCPQLVKLETKIDEMYEYYKDDKKN